MIEPNALSDVISATELASLGAERIQYSQAVSLKRIADAADDIAALLASPQISDLGPSVSQLDLIKDAVDGLTIRAADAGRTTSPEMASLAAKYMGMSDLDMSHIAEGFDTQEARDQFFADIRSLAASVLSQRADE